MRIVFRWQQTEQTETFSRLCEISNPQEQQSVMDLVSSWSLRLHQRALQQWLHDQGLEEFMEVGISTKERSCPSVIQDDL